MSEQKRKQNEKEFSNWENLPDGGRKYWFEIKGKHGGFARYTKITNSNEITLTFVQEIFDAQGSRTGIHEKYPVDKGHQNI